MLRLVVIIGVVVLFIWMLKRALDGVGSVFKIKIRHGTPILHGEIPGRSWLEVRDFLSELNLPSGSRITGYPDGKRFRLSFSDNVPKNERQRIRNFLYFGL